MKLRYVLLIYFFLFIPLLILGCPGFALLKDADTRVEKSVQKSESLAERKITYSIF